MEPSHDTPGSAAAPSAGLPALALVAAVAANGVIGRGNALPWRLPADLRHFRTLTTGHAVIMGRKTWESIGRPLPGRQNIVVTRQPGYDAPGAEIARSLDEALARVRLPDPAFCIGGGELYRQALARAQTLYLTEIARPFEGDTHFPGWDRMAWRETARETPPPAAPEDPACAFVTYTRVVA